MQKRKYNEPPRLEGYYYSFDQAKKARDLGNILTIRLETSRLCNLRCSYCCNKSGRPLKNELDYKTLINLIDQAKSLGAQSIIVIGGGEPTIYPKFRPLIKKIYAEGMIPVIFTNTQTMTKNLASFLYRHNVSVIIKLDSLDENLQDTMVGVPGAYKKIQLGLNNLLDKGYAKFIQQGKCKLGASFVVNRTNLSEVLDIWKFCRERKIFPNLEMMIPNGLAKENLNLILTKAECKELKLKLLKLDREKYGFNWLPYAPLVGCGCFQVMYNLYISIDGNVRPCSSIHCNIANVNKLTLKEIINIPFFRIARNMEKNLLGKCKNCKHHKECVGCRGLAYSLNKSLGKNDFISLCSEDPSCFLKS